MMVSIFEPIDPGTIIAESGIWEFWDCFGPFLVFLGAFWGTQGTTGCPNVPPPYFEAEFYDFDAHLPCGFLYVPPFWHDALGAIDPPPRTHFPL